MCWASRRLGGRNPLRLRTLSFHAPISRIFQTDRKRISLVKPDARAVAPVTPDDALDASRGTACPAGGGQDAAHGSATEAPSPGQVQAEVAGIMPLAFP